QRRIFADWQKYMVLYHVQPPPAGPVPSDVLKYVTAEIAELRDLDTARGDFAARIARLREEIEALLPDGLELVSIAAPRYYAPNDPVVLLSGDAVPGTPPDARATIACVLASNVLSSASFPAGIVSGSAAATVDASLLPAPAGALPHAVLAQLVQAELLLDPASADVPVAALAAQGGSQNPAVLDFTAAVTALVAAQQALIGGTTAPNGIAFAGKTPEPAIAMRAWRTPWNPVALSWRADVYPVDLPNGTYPERFVLDNFALDAGTFELELTGAVSAQAQGYAGTILLSPDASISLQNQITTYLRFVDDPELHDILTGLGSYPLLAQGLNGFDASLAMLEQILQMPVADPNAGDPINSYFSNTTVPNAVGPENRRGPLTSNAYNPLRAGKIAIRELLLVDEFGRSKKVDLEHLIVAETIPVDDMQTPPALVPPLRLAQSAQLWFRWLSAADPAIDATSLPATSPICGWAVPNHLSASMMWYDASGAAIGALTATAGGFVWQTAPGAGPAGQSFDDAFANRNPVLAAFARSMLANGTDYFIALLRTIDRTRVFVAPSNAQQDRATAVLLGAPLALVQADLSLELQGLPLPEQSYAALAADMQRPDPLHRTVRGFPQVRFPVTLGSLEQVDDGLIGYFLAPDGTADYATFYAEAANGEDAHIVVPEPSTITVAPADAQPRRVTMLVDARCAVHAFNGISPTKILTIPAEQYAQALATMAFTFLTSPVLTAAVVVTEPVPVPLPVLPGRAESRQFALPIPQEGDGTWTFVTYGEGRWTEIGIGTVDLNATFPSPLQLTEGWLKLSRAPKKT
ncbi:MAG: hypothetical protein QOJ39_2415, partial [Candidatus Eremiobacteraeota bacterium]|nr:hypothetical protein [Candidatus Eremiobacteraeota bacterium]